MCNIGPKYAETNKYAETVIMKKLQSAERIICRNSNYAEITIYGNNNYA